MADDWVVASNIGARLVELREAKGWLQRDLARKVGRGVNTISAWENGQHPPPKRVLVELAEDEGLPEEMFAEGGRMPRELVNPQLTGSDAVGEGTDGTTEIAALERDPDYPPEGSGLEPQMPDEDVLDLIMVNRQGFTRYLMTLFDQPRPVPVTAKLSFLDYFERLARERGKPLPTDHLDHLRSLIRSGGL